MAGYLSEDVAGAATTHVAVVVASCCYSTGLASLLPVLPTVGKYANLINYVGSVPNR